MWGKLRGQTMGHLAAPPLAFRWRPPVIPWEKRTVLSILSTLTQTSLLAVAGPSVAWSPKVAIVMISCNLFAISVGYYAIQQRGKGPALPLPLPAVFTGFGVPELLATASFGHLLGAGFILGMANAGLL